MNSQFPNPISSEIDFERTGIHSGYLRLPFSSHRSAYGWIPIPVASIKNGSGPRVVVMAGNHGDEYEGQVVLPEFLRAVRLEDVHGQIVLLPSVNAPAARANLRTSPLDQGNLNRVFPGDPRGTPTQVIAHYVETVILPGSDYLLDMHAGGSSLQYLSCTIFAVTGDEREKLVPYQLGTRHVLQIPANDKGALSSAAALRQGVAGFTVETGGAGTLTAESLVSARGAFYRFLAATGVYTNGSVDPGPAEEPQVFTETDYVFARSRGLFEPLVELGQEVRAGQPAALLHGRDDLYAEPERITFHSAGTVVAKRAVAPVEIGDCLFELGCARLLVHSL